MSLIQFNVMVLVLIRLGVLSKISLKPDEVRMEKKMLN